MAPEEEKEDRKTSQCHSSLPEYLHPAGPIPADPSPLITINSSSLLREECRRNPFLLQSHHLLLWERAEEAFQLFLQLWEFRLQGFQNEVGPLLSASKTYHHEECLLHHRSGMDSEVLQERARLFLFMSRAAKTIEKKKIASLIFVCFIF